MATPSPASFSATTTGHSLVRPTLEDLIRLSQPAAGLTLARPTARALQSGQYLSAFKGRGMEFDETRPYTHGDDVRNLDWRVTARTGKPHTKLFREERERPIFISVDNRAAMHFATRGVFKSVLAAKLAGLLAWTAQHHGDRIGGQIFSDTACRELKPQNGKHAVLRFLNALVQPAEKTADAVTLEHVLARLTQHARPGSRVYIISDFRGMNDKAETHLLKLSQHCDVVLVMVHDPLESALPFKGRYRFTDDSRDVVVDAESSAAAQYRQRFALRQQRLKQLAQSRGLAFMQCGTDDDPVQRLRYLLGHR